MNNWEVKHNGLQEELSIVEQLSVGRSVEWFLNNELERAWKEVIVA
jgi:hypothetical protein